MFVSLVIQFYHTSTIKINHNFSTNVYIQLTVIRLVDSQDLGFENKRLSSIQQAPSTAVGMMDWLQLIFGAFSLWGALLL